MRSPCFRFACLTRSCYWAPGSMNSEGARSAQPTGSRLLGVCFRFFLLGEVIAQFFEEILPPRANLFMLNFRELAQQFFLARGQVTRSLNDDLHQLVAARSPADVRHPSPSDSKDVAALTSPRNLDVIRALKCWNFDHRAQRGLRETDGDLADQIVAPAFEERMLLDDHLDPEVYPRTTHVAQFALLP